MEKIKKVVIDDMGNKKYFTIGLFKALQGLEFFDKAIEDIMSGSFNRIATKYLRDLLPLSVMTDPTGEKAVQQMSIEIVDTLFENPMSVVELGMEILEHQKVFMKDSEIFQKLKSIVPHLSTIKTSGSIN
ncbi:MAG: hypothetical protein ACK5N8_06845 [Alphaproteobacteria bacterium]